VKGLETRVSNPSPHKYYDIRFTFFINNRLVISMKMNLHEHRHRNSLSCCWDMSLAPPLVLCTRWLVPKLNACNLWNKSYKIQVNCMLNFHFSMSQKFQNGGGIRTYASKYTVTHNCQLRSVLETNILLSNILFVHKTTYRLTVTRILFEPNYCVL